MTGKDHLRWARDRALARLEEAPLSSVVLGFIHDLGMHPETAYLTEAEGLHALALVEAAAGAEERIRVWLEGWS